jgi:hypothetical protein
MVRMLARFVVNRGLSQTKEYEICVSCISDKNTCTGPKKKSKNYHMITTMMASQSWSVHLLYLTIENDQEIIGLFYCFVVGGGPTITNYFCGILQAAIIAVKEYAHSEK